MLKPINSIIKDSIRNIVFRGNVVTGTVAVDNGDGSYDVFISESDRAYPKIFTLSANPDLAVGDKVRILYMNGCKELPIILPPVTSIIPIDIGTEAKDRPSYRGANFTRIAGANSANAIGKITSVEVWANQTMAGAIVATFIPIDASHFTARDNQILDNGNGAGVVIAGSKQTFVVDLDVVKGDFLGIYYSSGKIERTIGLEEVGEWQVLFDQTSCENKLFGTIYSGNTISLYGTGSSN